MLQWSPCQAFGLVMSVLGLVTVGASVVTLLGVWPSDVSAKTGRLGATLL